MALPKLHQFDASSTGLTVRSRRRAKQASRKAARDTARRLIAEGLRDAEDRGDLPFVFAFQPAGPEEYEVVRLFPELPLRLARSPEPRIRWSSQHTEYPCERCGGYCALDFDLDHDLPPASDIPFL